MKPLWYAHEGSEIGICSYESSLKSLAFNNIQQVPPNMTVKMSLLTKKLLLHMANYCLNSMNIIMV